MKKKSQTPIFYPPSHYKKIGYLDVEDQPKFRIIIDACNLLGQGYKGVQAGWFKSKKYPDHYLWFPNFDENENWDNKISEDRMIISEKCKDVSKRQEWYDKMMDNQCRRICFPSTFDSMGNRYYQFVGVFETDFENASAAKGFQHKLIAKRFDI